MEDYWTYKAGTPTPDYDDLAPETFDGTREDWESLSPGMRREIVRHANLTRNNDDEEPRGTTPGCPEFQGNC